MNLIDFIITCGVEPIAANQTFLVSDGHDLSTPELIRKIAQAAGRPHCLWRFNASLLKALASLVGKTEILQRVCGNLQVDISKAKDLLGWVPPYSVDEGIKISVQGTTR